MTITSILDMHITEAARETALHVLGGVLVDTRAREGCLGVDVVVDLEDPLHIVALEHWATVEDDDAYRAWRATPEGANDLASILAAAPTLTRFEHTS
jgi:quinol monooxygenase YgiN